MIIKKRYGNGPERYGWPEKNARTFENRDKMNSCFGVTRDQQNGKFNHICHSDSSHLQPRSITCLSPRSITSATQINHLCHSDPSHRQLRSITSATQINHLCNSDPSPLPLRSITSETQIQHVCHSDQSPLPLRSITKTFRYDSSVAPILFKKIVKHNVHGVPLRCPVTALRARGRAET